MGAVEQAAEPSRIPALPDTVHGSLPGRLVIMKLLSVAVVALVSRRTASRTDRQRARPGNDRGRQR